MREIEFRGKRLDNGEWVYGDLIRVRCYTHDGKMYEEESVAIVSDTNFVEYDGQPHHHNWCFVDPATVGQYTGLKDRNGKKIYEGDIYKYTGTHWDDVVNECSWCDEGNFQGFDFSPFTIDNKTLLEIEVIGNIHDNPELIKA